MCVNGGVAVDVCEWGGVAVDVCEWGGGGCRCV